MEGINIMEVAGTYGVTSVICGFMFWRDWEREKARRSDRKEREVAERMVEMERIKSMQEQTGVLSKLATLIETLVK